MLEKNVIETTTAPVQAAEPLERAKGFWDQYSKPIIYIGTAIILAIGGWYAYQNFVVAPKEEKASEMIFPAENLFAKMASGGFSKDSVNIALNGGDLEGKKVTGLLKIVSQYGGTAAGNRANYMVGASYLQIGEFAKAIKYLEDFDANGASQVQSKAYVLLGHAYAEQKKTAEALSNYKKAASVNEKDEFFASDALILAAGYAESINNTKEAISLYKEVKEKYPTNMAVQSGEVDKNLARLGEME
ncbi:MAG: tetratricopeptide repeat protein [Gloeobacteraceae cyanobacterium ES-bin-316]|nr:tetratricopeptide repeat protein [Ferruginibacter sp.]